MPPSDPAVQKLSISTVEGSRIVVTAMYNPKEVSIDKSVPWSKSAQSQGDLPSLEFSSADGRLMSSAHVRRLRDRDERSTTYVDNLVVDPRAGPRRRRDKKRRWWSRRGVKAAGFPGRDPNGVDEVHHVPPRRHAGPGDLPRHDQGSGPPGCRESMIDLIPDDSQPARC